MKRSVLLLMPAFFMYKAFQAQISFSIKIDDVVFPFSKAMAGAEKIMNNQVVGITFSSDQKTCMLDFDYKKMEGKSSLSLSSELDNATYNKGFNITFKPNRGSKALWNTATLPISHLIISDFNLSNRTISGTFEAVVTQIKDDDGKFVAGKSSKTISIKGEFKNLPFTKVD